MEYGKFACDDCEYQCRMHLRIEKNILILAVKCPYGYEQDNENYKRFKRFD